MIAGWNDKLPHQQIANPSTTWRFITPAAPHHGCMWKAGVKAVKHHLRRIIGAQRLTSNQLYTFLTQIEACINSRPIVPISEDANDLEALTPGHFFVGRPLLQPMLTENVLNRQPPDDLGAAAEAGPDLLEEVEGKESAHASNHS